MMKKIIYLSMLLIFATVSCKKNNMETFDSGQGNTVTDTVLRNKFIDPFRKAECFKLMLKSKNRDDTTEFFLFKNEGKYMMAAQIFKYAQPQEVKLSFGTNATTATLSFSEDAPFFGILNDLGGELTRSMDISYSFVAPTEKGFELEGNRYGDKLELRYMDLNSDLIQNLKTGAMYKTLKGQMELFDKKLFNSLVLNGIPVQIILNPLTNEIWTLYSENSKAEIETTAIVEGEIPISVYKPRLSTFSTYTYSNMGDTLRLATPIVFKDMTIKELIWKKNSMTYQADVTEAGQHRLVPFATSNVPVYSFALLATYINSIQLEEKNISHNFKAFLATTNIPMHYSVDFGQVINNPIYTIGWSSRMKESALKVAAKLKDNLGNNKTVKLEVTSTIPFLAIFPGMSFDQSLNYYENNRQTSSSFVKILQQLILGAQFNSDSGLLGYGENMLLGIDYLATFTWEYEEKPLGQAAFNIWPELYEFVKIYDSAKLKMTYLPPATDGGKLRIQIKNISTGDTFIADGI